MKPFKDFYGEGVDEKKLTIEQSQNRWRVLNDADQILAGAQVSGRRMDPSEALERAHLLLTDSMRDEKVRKQLVAKVKQRSNGITLKPKSQSTQTGNKPTTAADAEARVGQKLAEIFG
jgi:hypothetical protein